MNYKTLIIIYLVVGLLVGALKIFSNLISTAYCTGKMKKETFLDRVVIIIKCLLLWPYYVMKKRI